MKRLKFDLRDLKLVEIILYGILGFFLFFIYKDISTFWFRVMVLYLILDVTIRRLEIEVHNLNERGNK